MKPEVSVIMDEVMKDGIWDEILSPGAEIGLADLLKLSTDYSCHGCAF